MALARLRGLLVRLDEELRFVPASVAVQVAAVPRMTAVTAAPPQVLGIALFSGVVIPVLSVGAARSEMVVCQCAGELVGIVGLRVVEIGVFEVVGERPERVAYGGEVAALLDVPAFCAGVQAAALARPRVS
jgi:hypothetical protein